MPESTGRCLCIINYNSCNGWICVPSEGERERDRQIIAKVLVVVVKGRWQAVTLNIQLKLW